MIPKILTIISVSCVLGDPCRNLSHLLNLSEISYTKNNVCHALFWQTSRGSGPICTRSSKTGPVCPSTYKLYVSEAEAELRKFSNAEIAPTVGPSEGIADRKSGPLNDKKNEKKGEGDASFRDAKKKEEKKVKPTSFPDEKKKEKKQKSSPRRPIGVNVGVTHPDFVKQRPSRDLSLVVLGDVGKPTNILRTTAAALLSKMGTRADAAVLLGDNFYPTGIHKDLGVKDPQFKEIFEDIVAQGLPSNVPFHVVLGNHDWLGDPEAQIQYSKVNPRWIMPSNYYMRRFIGVGFTACAWFLDTFPVDGRDKENKCPTSEAQLRWFTQSLEENRGNCDWKVAFGHHPLFDAGEYHDNERMITAFEASFQKYGVNLYVSGHDHKTMVLRNKAEPAHTGIHYIVTGYTAQSRPLRKEDKGKHPMEAFIDQTTPAYVELVFGQNALVYKVHDASKRPQDAPLYEDFITHRG
jgi:tartrate-resistant acid phosphatase type 5